MIDKRSPVSRRKADCDHACIYESQIQELHDCVIGLKFTMASLPEVLSAKISEGIMSRVDTRFDEKLKMFFGGLTMWVAGILGAVLYGIYEIFGTRHP